MGQSSSKLIDSSEIQEHTMNAINQILSSKQFELFQPLNQDNNNQKQKIQPQINQLEINGLSRQQYERQENQDMSHANQMYEKNPSNFQNFNGHSMSQGASYKMINQSMSFEEEKMLISKDQSKMSSFEINQEKEQLNDFGFGISDRIGNSQEKNKVIKFFKTLLTQHQQSQKLSLITLQISKILNIIISSSLNLAQGMSQRSFTVLEQQKMRQEINKFEPSHTGILGELFNLVNLLIYPQRIYLTQNPNDSSLRDDRINHQYDSSQAKVRDVILYLKVMKQILNLRDGVYNRHNDYSANREQFGKNEPYQDDCLFALSDIIDDSCLNHEALIRHLMYVWERIVGIQLDKIESLTQADVNQLQNDLSPILSLHLNQLNAQENQAQLHLASQLEANQSASMSLPNLAAHKRNHSSFLPNKVMQSQNHGSQNNQFQTDQQLSQKVNFLEQKLRAYKQEYVKAKALCKQQDKIINKYEQALLQLSQKKSSLQKQQQMKNQIFESFLQSLKKDYQNELQKLKAQGSLLDESQSEQRNNKQQDRNNQQEARSRSISPLNFEDREKKQLSLKINFSQFQPAQSMPQSQTLNQQQTNYGTKERNSFARATQTDDDNKDKLIEELEKELEASQKDLRTLTFEKRELLKDKHSFNDQLATLQEQIDQLQEKFDKKNRKHQILKKQIEDTKIQGSSDQVGIDRIKEELEMALKQKSEAEKRTKKFETQFRAGLKEINELREQVEQLQNEKEAKEQEIESLQMPQNQISSVFLQQPGGSDSQSSSFLMLSNQAAAQQAATDIVRIQELEKERDLLLQKVALLERSNQDLLAYKRSIEDTIKEISSEKDDQKKLQLVQLNLIRRKSLLRLEHAALFSESNQIGGSNSIQRSLTPDRLTRSTSNLGRDNSQGRDSSQQYRGQKQQIYQQFTPGNRVSQMTAPNSLNENQLHLQNQKSLLSRDMPSPINYNTHGSKHPDLGEILDEFQRLEEDDGEADRNIRQRGEDSPRNRSQLNMRQSNSYGLLEQNEKLSSNTQSHKNLNESLNLSQNERVAQNLFNPVQAYGNENNEVFTNRATATFRDSFSQPQSQSLIDYKPNGEDSSKNYTSSQDIQRYPQQTQLEDKQDAESDSNQNDQEEEEEQKGNFLMMQLKKQMSKKVEDKTQNQSSLPHNKGGQTSNQPSQSRNALPNVQKSIIKEVENEDEYDDEEDSSEEEDSVDQ